MNFTVFGSTGFIGSHLRDYLRSKGIDVFCPERNVDLTTLRGLGHVVYCIGLTADFREKPFETIEAHICKLKHVLQVCEFESFTYLSSTRVYIHSSNDVDEESLIPVSAANPFDLFNSSKLTGELLTLNCGKENCKVVRVSNVYGNDFASKNFLTSILQSAIHTGKIVLRTTPDSAKDYIAIDDVTRMLFEISSTGKSKIYNLASGVNTSNEQICRIIQLETGCIIEYAPAAEQIIFPKIQVTKMTNEFGFAPSVEMGVSLKKIIADFKILANDTKPG